MTLLSFAEAKDLEAVGKRMMRAKNLDHHRKEAYAKPHEHIHSRGKAG